jgi:hypothetical protein
MKPIILYPKRTWTHGMVLFPFVIINRKRKDDKTLLNHELIHWAQVMELWVLGFYLLYIYYHIRMSFLKKHHPFEQECDFNERQLGYLETRKPFSWRVFV